jgi:hypothetical protein
MALFSCAGSRGSRHIVVALDDQSKTVVQELQAIHRSVIPRSKGFQPAIELAVILFRCGAHQRATKFATLVEATRR